MQTFRTVKESYKNLELVLINIQYQNQGCQLCVDLIIISVIRSKINIYEISLFLCEQDSTELLHIKLGTIQQKGNVLIIFVKPFLRNIVYTILGNRKHSDYKNIVVILLITLGYNKNIKLHFLDCYLDVSPKNWGDFSHEQ